MTDVARVHYDCRSRPEEDEADRAREGSDSENEDGESREKREAASGPWNKSNPPPTVADAPGTVFVAVGMFNVDEAVGMSGAEF